MFLGATYFHLRVVFLHDELFQAHKNIPLGYRFSTWWIVPGAQKYSIWLSFFKALNCSRRTTYFGNSTWSLQDRFSYKNCYRRTKIFHFRIVFLRDELFLNPGAQRIFISKNENCFSKMNCFRHAKISHFRLSFFKAMNYSWIQAHNIFNFFWNSLGNRFSTDCFSMNHAWNVWTFTAPRIPLANRFSTVAHDELFQARKNIPLTDRFSTRWIFPGAPHISTAGSLFNESYKNCYKRTKILHLRFVVLHMNCAWRAPHIPFQDRLTFSSLSIVQTHKNIPFQYRFSLSQRWFVSGAAQIYHLRIVFPHNATWIVPGAPRISTRGSLLYTWIVPGPQKYCTSMESLESISFFSRWLF